MLPQGRPAVIPGASVLLALLGSTQIVLGLLFLSLRFPFAFFCGFAIFLGVANILVAGALYTMQRWAWPIAIALLVLSAVFTFPAGTVPAILLLVYLLKPEVRAGYGYGRPVPPPLWGMAPPYVPDPWAPSPPPPAVYAAPAAPPPIPRLSACRNCGAPLDARAIFCPACGARVQ